MMINPAPTRIPELNAILAHLAVAVQEILGKNFIGAYLQGSFAVGDWDKHSDVDFIVAIDHEISDAEFSALREMHYAIFDQPVSWAQHLEGSYFPRLLLRCEDLALTPLVYIDNAHRELERSTHDNTLVVRWTLREHGIILAGQDPRTLIDPVDPDDLRREVRAVMRDWGAEILSGRYSIDNRWAQAFAVISYCRMLQTLETGTVESKPAGVRWGLTHLDARWTDLIQRAWGDRPDPGIKVRQAADERDVLLTEAFIRYAIDLNL